jgi:hypothetical protein
MSGPVLDVRVRVRSPEGKTIGTIMGHARLSCWATEPSRCSPWPGRCIPPRAATRQPRSSTAPPSSARLARTPSAISTTRPTATSMSAAARGPRRKPLLLAGFLYRHSHHRVDRNESGGAAGRAMSRCAASRPRLASETRPQHDCPRPQSALWSQHHRGRPQTRTQHLITGL